MLREVLFRPVVVALWWVGIRLEVLGCDVHCWATQLWFWATEPRRRAWTEDLKRRHGGGESKKRP